MENTFYSAEITRDIWITMDQFHLLIAPCRISRGMTERRLIDPMQKDGRTAFT